MTFAHLERHQGYWALTKQDSFIFWWMNTFKYHDFHDKTAERKTLHATVRPTVFTIV